MQTRAHPHPEGAGHRRGCRSGVSDDPLALGVPAAVRVGDGLGVERRHVLAGVDGLGQVAEPGGRVRFGR